MKELTALTQMSRKYGADSQYVLAGGGNTSYKSEDTLYIKGSGTALATIQPEQFVKMDRASLAKMWETKYSDLEAEREAQVLADMMNSRKNGETGRPSVETLLHDLFIQKYVLHVHPALVNGITCSKEGKIAAARLFPDAIWVAACKPGYILANECRLAIDNALHAGKAFPNLLFLENHGVFFAGSTTEEIDILVNDVMTKVAAEIKVFPDLSPAGSDPDRVAALTAAIRSLYGEGNTACVNFSANKEILHFDETAKSATPDHIVYTKANVLCLEQEVRTDALAERFAAFAARNGYKPKIVLVKGLGMFACGMSDSEAVTARDVFFDELKIMIYAKSFGGYSPMCDELIDFIVNWEVERYRAKVSLSV